MKDERTEEHGDRIQVWEGCLKDSIELAPAGAPAWIDVQRKAGARPRDS